MKKFFLTLAFLCASHSLAPVFAQEYKMAGPYEVVARDGILGIDLPIPEKLQAFMRGTKQSVPLPKDFSAFKAFLMRK